MTRALSEVASGVSLDINPASRQALEQLIREGGLAKLVQAGARLHQTGCNGLRLPPPHSKA
jgi:aconitate hydratase